MRFLLNKINDVNDEDDDDDDDNDDDGGDDDDVFFIKKCYVNSGIRGATGPIGATGATGPTNVEQQPGPPCDGPIGE